jgi:DNA repair protein RecO (recombination protein O)
LEQHTKGIVFQTIKYKDNQIIARIFTKSLGLKAFLVRTSKKGKSSKAAQLQPFTILELNVKVKENTSLATFSDARIAIPFSDIPFNPVKSAIVLFLNEVLYKTVADDYQNDELYDFIENALQLLDHSKQVRNFHLWFLAQLTKYYGFSPIEDDTNFEQDYFDFVSGQFTNMRPGHKNYIEGHYKVLWAQMLTITFDQMDALKISGVERKGLLEYLLHYIKLHLENVREFKSLDVLHEVFTSETQ